MTTRSTLSEWRLGKLVKNDVPCEAFVDWPGQSEMCWEPALFVVERVADAPLTTCAKHLGPILQHARNVLWPQTVEWIGPGSKPRNSISAGSQEAARTGNI